MSLYFQAWLRDGAMCRQPDGRHRSCRMRSEWIRFGACPTTVAQSVPENARLRWRPTTPRWPSAAASLADNAAKAAADEQKLAEEQAAAKARGEATAASSAGYTVAREAETGTVDPGKVAPAPGCRRPATGRNSAACHCDSRPPSPSTVDGVNLRRRWWQDVGAAECAVIAAWC